jgi:hypothetical protein
MMSRKASRQVPRRVPEPRMVPFPRRSKGDHRSMAAARAAAFESQLSQAQRVRGARSKTSAVRQRAGRCGTWGVRALPPGDGPNAAVHGGLRAPARCATVPSGHVQPAREETQANRGPKNRGRSRFVSSCQRLLSRRIRFPIHHGMGLPKVLSAPAQPAIDSSLASLRSLHRRTLQSSCFGTLLQTRVA